MKKILLSAAFIAASFTSIAQVGLGTTTPEAALDIKSNVSEATAYTLGNGVLVPRFDVLPAVAGADEGELVYVNGLGLYYYTGTDTVWTAVGDSYGYGQCRVKVSPTAYKTFLCHNLGADTSTDPHTPQIGNQGAYIQWGKKGPSVTNEDVRVTWLTAVNDASEGFAAASTVNNNNDAFISGWSGTSAAGDGSWNGTENSPVKVIENDPCPTGYRVPTRIEWIGVNANNTASRTVGFVSNSTNYGAALHYGPDASTKLLTLPAAGFRNSDSNGALASRGNLGVYWSSTEDGGSNAYDLRFNSSVVAPANNSNRTDGLSVRCIAE
jgi:uncharacterized protein (TIGR02145 family)